MWGLMVAAHGFEPRTHRVWTDCSSQLSYAAMYGASDRDWTGDLILTKDTLCRLSYTSTMNDHFTVNFCGCGDRTWTCDLRVMSPTSYQLLHPAINGGGRRIRTFEVEDGRFTVCSLWPLGNPSKNKMELAIGIEPTTCWLQVSCSTVEPHQHIGGNNRTRTCDPLINSQLLYLLSYIPIYLILTCPLQLLL